MRGQLNAKHRPTSGALVSLRWEWLVQDRLAFRSRSRSTSALAVETARSVDSHTAKPLSSLDSVCYQANRASGLGVRCWPLEDSQIRTVLA
jgi:hypothetical protein